MIIFKTENLVVSLNPNSKTIQLTISLFTVPYIQMVDVKKHIAYWVTGAKDDREVAKELAASGRYRHGLFFAHLALEKILKSHVCKNTDDLAPRLHNLVRLSELAGLKLDQEQIEFLADMNTFNLEGRYPDVIAPQLSKAEATDYIKRTEEVFEWLVDQL